MVGYLRRYTTIPVLIYLLKRRKITLLNPDNWDDRNDSHYLAVYRQKKRLKSVLALCFTQETERYHHWQVFAGGPSGVCIQFHRDILLRFLNNQTGVTFKNVRYLKVKTLNNLKVVNLPFLKRHPYKDEHEFRIIYESDQADRDFLDIPISLSCIDRITLSPWMAPVLREDLVETIRAIPKCSSLEIRRSTLISNARWKNAGSRAR